MSEPSLRLDGRNVVVFGAAGGLGISCVDAFVALGARVVGVDLEVGSARTTHRDVTWLTADTVDEGQVRAAFDGATETLGELHGFVSATGTLANVPLEDMSADEWCRVIDVNLNGVFLQVREAADRLADGGAMVLFSSVAGRSGREFAAHYAASKAGVISLVKSAALRYSPRLRVNGVCPGQFLTPMWDKIMADRDATEGPGAGERWRQSVLSRVPLERAGTAAELAAVVAFLLSDASAYVTGQSINVDGGLEMD